MKLIEKIEELTKGNEKEIDKFLGLNSIGTILNLIEEGINELGYEDLNIKFKELINLILDKRKELGDRLI